MTDCYRTHVWLVRSYLRRFVPSQEIDDVTQIVFTEAWRSRERYDPTRSMEAWLLGIARKRAIDHLRSRRVPTVSLEVVCDPPDNRDPGTLLADRDSLRRALDELPEAQRQAIELAYFGDLTQREIAEHLHIPLGTIKARTARGLHRLQTLLVAA
ncbi:sigma-70 family RNA polymerase sigma factor [Nonomuraea sp. NBC_01738]|uniref:RNA polymerase sigma factor n=1 Tax=Nonomuraea sp. NBC_01738 TaxID=2976003 RepID=UPI002E14EE04|nr:sigma-70 family RNA polymerase sigma factor [Nonomuraea sp. NBC_01738]